MRPRRSYIHPLAALRKSPSNRRPSARLRKLSKLCDSCRVSSIPSPSSGARQLTLCRLASLTLIPRHRSWPLGNNCRYLTISSGYGFVLIICSRTPQRLNGSIPQAQGAGEIVPVLFRAVRRSCRCDGCCNISSESVRCRRSDFRGGLPIYALLM